MECRRDLANSGEKDTNFASGTDLLLQPGPMGWRAIHSLTSLPVRD